MRTSALGIAVVAIALNSWATTLQQLTLADMIQRSTLIVRGKARPATSAAKGSVIYTHYVIDVADQWKGSAAAQIDVAVPGGLADGHRQTYSGAPAFATGQDYVFFLWTSRTGLTQVIGLSQGLFSVTTDSSGVQIASRVGITSPMLDAYGHPVMDSAISMPVPELRAKVASVLAGKGAQ